MEPDQGKRRSFLKHILAGVAVVAGSAAAIKPAAAGSATRTKGGSESGSEVLYHESESFKKYYESLR